MTKNKATLKFKNFTACAARSFWIRLRLARAGATLCYSFPPKPFASKYQAPMRSRAEWVEILKSCRLASLRKFRNCFCALKFQKSCGDKFNPQRALFRDFGGLAEESIHLGDQNFFAVLRAVCELGETCLGGAHALARIARLCSVVLRIGGS